MSDTDDLRALAANLRAATEREWEAATRRLTAAKAENVRLRGVLEQIANPHSLTDYWPDLQATARAALKGEKP